MSVGPVVNFIEAPLDWFKSPPKSGQWIASDGSQFVQAQSTSDAEATVLGIVYSVTAVKATCFAIGSMVPLSVLGTLAQLKGLSTQGAYLQADGTIGDCPTSGTARLLFVIPVPRQRLTSAMLSTTYAMLESGRPQAAAYSP